METQGIKYIGSKDKLLEELMKIFNGLTSVNKTVIDVFTGTTRVAQALKQNGYEVLTSDLSDYSEVFSDTYIASNNLNHLIPVINNLNNVIPSSGWITNNYCDVKSIFGDKNIKNDGLVRFWQPKNGMKADAIRDEIEKLVLKKEDKSALITSLILALDKVDNTVGVQQACLKDWCDRSYNDLKLELPKSIKGLSGKHIKGDALKIKYPEYDIAYMDPPYTNHNYGTYYHIWDSIVLWDKPNVTLKTHRREDRTGNNHSKSSKWNKKNEALIAFETLIKNIPTKYVVISYNNEGIIPNDEFLEFVNKYNNQIYSIDYKRNIMSSIGNATKYKIDFKTENQEYIIVIEK